MATKKDMRRADLVVPYVDPASKKKDGDMASALSSTLPMAAMFTRSRMIGWTSVVFSLQNWMAESPEQKKNSSTPGYLSVIMSVMAVIVTYVPLFLPPQAGRPGKAAPTSSPTLAA
ncbi:uncharacterized protein CIMG_00401 [Coccidioides immitis RS]|uniref:Uncharacterized protein n=1 Tax=Coccidioides immitis (strain RS) TaxID=246410 RepID=J3KGX9_COCIM|nr:uncharacterized protein CIMG_00401 [Coccidioides immitis RS]EAS35047.3 hypothetical protein CIMG_00401 [Coccidioides immitis RS]